MSEADELTRMVRTVVEQVVRELQPGGGTASTQQGAAPQTPAPQLSDRPASQLIPAQARRVAIGADHGGYAMEEALKRGLRELGYAVEDCGTCSTEAGHCPDF